MSEGGNRDKVLVEELIKEYHLEQLFLGSDVWNAFKKMLDTTKAQVQNEFDRAGIDLGQLANIKGKLEMINRFLKWPELLERRLKLVRLKQEEIIESEGNQSPKGVFK